MTECSDLDYKTRYIKFKHHIVESADSEQGEIDEATGGVEKTADENVAEQFFLETTVWIVKWI